MQPQNEIKDKLVFHDDDIITRLIEEGKPEDATKEGTLNDYLKLPTIGKEYDENPERIEREAKMRNEYITDLIERLRLENNHLDSVKTAYNPDDPRFVEIEERIKKYNELLERRVNGN